MSESKAEIEGKEDKTLVAEEVLAAALPPGGRSADKMAENMIGQFAQNPDLANDLQNSPGKVRDFAEVAKVAADAQQVRDYDLEIIKSNGQLYMLVAGCIGAVLVVVVISIAYLSVSQLALMKAPIDGTITFAIPDGLIALGSAAIGALAGLLTPLSRRT